MSDIIYAGWKNYETWALNSWFLMPEQYDKWQEIARQCIKRNAGKAGAWPEDAIHELAKQMHESILNGVIESSGVYSQMVDHAIKVVDWYSIAKGFIESAEGGSSMRKPDQGDGNRS